MATIQQRCINRQPGIGDPAALGLAEQLRSLGYPINGVTIERVVRVEGLGEADCDKLVSALSNPVLDQVTRISQLYDWMGWPIRDIAFQRAVTDPELDAARRAGAALGLPAFDWLRLSRRYQFRGVDQPMADEIVTRLLCNAQVETIIAPGEVWPTLVPQGTAGPVERFDLARMGADELLALNQSRRLFLSLPQLSAIRDFYVTAETLARDGELEMTAGAWGDHCYHTTWKTLQLLQRLQAATARIDHPDVISAFSDNSGVFRFFGGWALNIKGETHISPSSVSTYGGIMTKHGGVIRDVIFTGQGARPIAGTTIMGVCNVTMPWAEVPAGALHPRVIFRESVRGTKDYTDPMGIPMAHAAYLEHPGNVKCFALGHSIGILPEARAQQGKPRSGDFVVLIGGATGRDGLHGATVSSGAMTATTATVDAAHVQIGMPIEERKFMEAVPVLRDAGCIRACTDCGAAGLSSAVGELGQQTGVWVNLAWAPRKCASMLPWEIWLSESQERGVLVVPPKQLTKALERLNAFEVPATVIGYFTATKRCQVIYDDSLKATDWLGKPEPLLQGEIVVDLPYTFLSQDCPLPKIAVKAPTKRPRRFIPPLPKNEDAWLELFGQMLGHFNLCDQSLAARQYDQTVQGATVQPLLVGKTEQVKSDVFVATPVLDKPWGACTANSVSQYLAEVDPYGAGWLIYANAVAKLVAVGISPRAIATNVNVYTPRVTDQPENAWRLCQLVEGYAAASEALGVPVISGKDSSSGTFFTADGRRIDAPLTIDVLAIGKTADVGRTVGKLFPRPGEQIVAFHPGLHNLGSLGGSILLDLYQQRGAGLPVVDLAGVYRYWLDFYRHCREISGLVTAATTIAEGGLFYRLFEMSFGSGFGCKVRLDRDPLLQLFSEPQTVLLCTTANLPAWELFGPHYTVLGEVTDDDQQQLEVTAADGSTLVRASVQTLARAWEKMFKEVL